MWVCHSYFRWMDVQTHTDRLVLLGWGLYLVAEQGWFLGGLLSRLNYSAWQEAICNPAILYCFNLSVSFVSHLCLSLSSPHTHYMLIARTWRAAQTPYHQCDITSQISSRGKLVQFGVSHSISLCVTILLTHWWLPYCTCLRKLTARRSYTAAQKVLKTHLKMYDYHCIR